MGDRRRAWAIFSVMAATYSLSHFYRVSTALIAVDLSVEFGLGPDRLSLLGGIFFYVFASVQVPLGPLLDRFGAKRIVVASTCLGAVGSFAFALSPGWWGLVLGRSLMGLGMAPVLMGSLKLLAGWFPPTAFGTLSGFLLALGTLGSILAATPLAGLVAWLGWRGTFLLFSVLTLAGAASIAWAVRDSPTASHRTGPGVRKPLEGLVRVFTLPAFWAMVPLGLVGYASVVSIQGLWAGPYFMEELGYSRAQTGNILLGLGLFTAVGSTTGGYLSDRIFRSRKWVVTAGNTLAVVCMLPLLGIPGPSSPAGWTMLFATLGFGSAFRILLYAHVKESIPDAFAGTAVTAVNLFIMAGPALMQQAMGLVLEARPGDYRSAFAIPVAALVLGSLAYLFARDTHPSAPASGST